MEKHQVINPDLSYTTSEESDDEEEDSKAGDEEIMALIRGSRSSIMKCCNSSACVLSRKIRRKKLKYLFMEGDRKGIPELNIRKWCYNTWEHFVEY